MFNQLTKVMNYLKHFHDDDDDDDGDDNDDGSDNKFNICPLFRGDWFISLSLSLSVVKLCCSSLDKVFRMWPWQKPALFGGGDPCPAPYAGPCFRSSSFVD